jgi:2-keto-4-pentenoate hydratase/2-oxohepta-3-ene-1,7-dioic acid hydratase in catechol pathway
MTFEAKGARGLAVLEADGGWRGLIESQDAYPGSLLDLLRDGEDAVRRAGVALQTEGRALDLHQIQILPPVPEPGKIICIGLNYASHTEETGLASTDYPDVFIRFPSSLVGAEHALFKPLASDAFDFEGELVAVIGRRGRRIARSDALDHVAGWSIFNEGSVRDFQMRASQWTLGKNFDRSGAFGPHFVTADEVTPGGRDLVVETRLNGQVMQHASTNDLVHDVPALIQTLSEAMTLEPGDLIATGTPAGVGMSRKPPVWMKSGDVVEVEIQGVGVLRNVVLAEPATADS